MHEQRRKQLKWSPSLLTHLIQDDHKIFGKCYGGCSSSSTLAFFGFSLPIPLIDLHPTSPPLPDFLIFSDAVLQLTCHLLVVCFSMDLQLVKEGFRFSSKRKNWVVVFLASGLTCYAAYRLHRSPLFVPRRDKLFRFLGAFVAVAEAVSNSAESVSVISKDLTDFLRSDSDVIPNSFKQISKLSTSGEFSDSLIRFTQAITLGVAKGHQSNSNRDGDKFSSSSSFIDQTMDKIFTANGSNFASAVVGSFARNLIMGFFSVQESNGELNNSTENLTNWVNVVCSDKPRELIGDCIQLFVSTAVAVYLEKTSNINTYNELFSGLTNHNHETQIREMLVSVCNGAVETLVKTSYQVMSDSNPNQSSPAPIKEEEEEEEEASSSHLVTQIRGSNWVSKISSTFAVPSNRKLVVDITGTVTFQTVRSFMEFLVEKLCEVMKTSAALVEEAIVDCGMEILRYASAKSSVLATVCLSLFLHIIDGPTVFIPA